MYTNGVFQSIGCSRICGIEVHLFRTWDDFPLDLKVSIFGSSAECCTFWTMRNEQHCPTTISGLPVLSNDVITRGDVGRVLWTKISWSMFTLAYDEWNDLKKLLATKRFNIAVNDFEGRKSGHCDLDPVYYPGFARQLLHNGWPCTLHLVVVVIVLCYCLQLLLLFCRYLSCCPFDLPFLWIPYKLTSYHHSNWLITYIWELVPQ